MNIWTICNISNSKDCLQFKYLSQGMVQSSNMLKMISTHLPTSGQSSNNLHISLLQGSRR